MKIKAVLFDLDGTLLPMDQDVFLEAYFGGIAKKMVPYGYEKKALLDSIWVGTMDMVKNTGATTNEVAFWNKFATIHGEHVRAHEPIFADFYRYEFEEVRHSCGYNPKAREVVDKIKARGARVALATNPIFPAMATVSRMRWAGFEPKDFELFTAYENACHCKPNLAYYKDILAEMGLEGSDCLMVGNDVGEDMVASALGMQVFLLTDCLINRKDEDISRYPHGDFDALSRYIDEVL